MGKAKTTAKGTHGGRRPGTGGKQPGAGRPPGSKNTLGYGEVKAIQVARWRVPETAPPEAASVADRALERIVEVMDGKVHYLNAGHVLKAATRVREEVCGPIAQKVEHAGSVSIQVVNPYAEDGDED